MAKPKGVKKDNYAFQNDDEELRTGLALLHVQLTGSSVHKQSRNFLFLNDYKIYFIITGINMSG